MEIGAGMMPYGYALAAHAEQKFCGSGTVLCGQTGNRSKGICGGSITRGPKDSQKVLKMDILSYLEDEPDDLLCLLACGIEDCILPGMDYKFKVEKEIGRTLDPEAFFISSHSDLLSVGLIEKEFVFPRPSNPRLTDRLRIHGSRNAYELSDVFLPDERSLGFLTG